MATLKIDLDYKMGRACRWTKWCQEAARLLVVLDLRPTRIAVRDTGRGHHVEIDVPLYLDSGRGHPQRNGDLIIVALQAILGSDRFREALNLGRALRGEPENILFAEKAVYRDYRLVRRHQALDNKDFVRILERALERAFSAKAPVPDGAPITDSGRRRT